VEVLVEGPSKRAQKFDRTDESEETPDVSPSARSLPAVAELPPSPITQLVGRTTCDRIVVFEGNRRHIGQILPITVLDCTSMTLFGAVVTREVGPEVYSLA